MLRSTRTRLLTTTMIGGALAISLATVAAAQEAPTPGSLPGAPGTTAPSDQPGEVEELVVTGSRIPAPNLTSVSPVTVLNNEEVKVAGTTRIEDLVNSLPQAFAAQGGSYSNGATGTANVNLRGLGSIRTLVLIDGRRLLPGDPNQAQPAADLNNIPAALVERAEVLTGGASAVYGADAVAGVVNFIMQKDFEGFRVDAQYSFYQHENDNEGIQSILNGRGFPARSDSVTDGFTKDVTAIMGVNSADGKGNITAYAGYRSIDPIVQRNRDYSGCSLTQSGSTFVCGGSGTTGPGGQFLPAGGTGAGLTLDPAAPNNGNGFRAYSSARDAFNFGPYNYFQRPDERYNFGAFGRYEINDHAEVYTQLMFMDDRTAAQIAPSGIFLQTLDVNCANPFLSASQVTALCGPTVDQDPATAGIQTAASRGGLASVAIGRRNLEGGGRVSDLRHTTYRGVFGVRGQIDQNWNYDVYAQYGTVVYQQVYQNDFSIVRSQRALLATRNAAGQIVCTSVIDGSDPNCAPYNIFSLAGPSAESLAYLQTPGFIDGTTREHVVNGSIAGQLGDYGLKSPFANDGLGVAVGAEYRREALELRPDTAFQTGDLAGQGGATLGVEGSFDVYELFGEIRAPLIEDKPFAKSLTFETGYRFSDYNTGETTHTYKFGGDYEPFDGLRFRASYQRAVRAPAITELFSSQSVALGNLSDDICANDPITGALPSVRNPIATAANCARTGLTLAQYGTVLNNPANQYNSLLGGNPNLAPEESDSYSYGVVYQPSFLPRFNVSLDYFNIEIEGLIAGVSPDVTLEQCVSTGNPFFCGLIRRAPGTGSLFLGNNNYVQETLVNSGAIITRGVDVAVNYGFDFSDFGMADIGGLSFNLVGTWLDKLETTPLPGQAPYECAGNYAGSCGTPNPEWRHKLRVTWTTPWDAQLSGAWRYFASVDSVGNTAPVHAKIPSQDYFDVAATFRLRDQYTFRVGVNNVLDSEPPVVGSANCPAGPCNGNTFAQVYDSAGRYVFIGLTADF